MATIMCLPNEIIFIILKDESISPMDVANFSSTCTRFWQILQSNDFWEIKFHQRWPSIKKKFGIQKFKRYYGDIDFREITKTGLESIKTLQYYASLLSNNNEYIWLYEQSNLESFLKSTIDNSIIYLIVSDEYHRIVPAKLSQQPSNLSSGYNFDLIFHCLKQYQLMYKLFENFLYAPVEKQLPEQFYISFAQYFYPHLSYSIMQTSLDKIAKYLLSRLKIEYPSHSIFSVSPEKFSFWRDNNIDDNFWDEREAKQIMYILEKYLFSVEIEKKLYDCPLFEYLALLDISQHSLVNFIPYPLIAIHHSVARRLGILCVPIFNKHENCIGFAWKPKYNRRSWENAMYYLQSKEFFTVSEPELARRRYNDVSNQILLKPLIDLWKLWRSELIRNFSQLIHGILKDHCGIITNWAYNLLTFAYIENYERNEFFDRERKLYKHITEGLMIKPIIRSKKKSKRREEKIKFAVGMIVTVIDSSRSNLPPERKNIHDGVIIGWHFKCKRYLTSNSLDSIIPQLRFCEFYNHEHTCICRCDTRDEIINQPHYIILADNNILCYAPQCNVSTCSPKWIQNVEIEKYFSRFEGTHYVPNKKLAEAYPYDMDAIINIHTATNADSQAATSA